MIELRRMSVLSTDAINHGAAFCPSTSDNPSALPARFVLVGSGATSSIVCASPDCSELSVVDSIAVAVAAGVAEAGEAAALRRTPARACSVKRARSRSSFAISLAGFWPMVI